MIDEKMILEYAKSLMDEAIAAVADYGAENQMTQTLMRDYRALRRMWLALTDGRILTDDIERLLDGEYD